MGMSMEQDQSGHALLDMWYKLIVMIGISVFIVTKSVEMFELDQKRDVITAPPFATIEEILLNIDYNLAIIAEFQVKESLMVMVKNNFDTKISRDRAIKAMKSIESIFSIKEKEFKAKEEEITRELAKQAIKKQKGSN